MTDMPWSNNSSHIELKLVYNGKVKRLLLVERFAPSTNFWVHDDGTFTRVLTEQEIETLKMAYEAVDSFNKEQMFKRNIRP
jgi:hypothetical protein